MIGLVVIMAYFLIIFFVIYILSNELLDNVDLLFKFKIIESSFINIINNMDLLAYSTTNDSIFDNIMS